MSRALRFHANLPKKFWGECILTATHIINKLPTRILGWKSPYEVLFHKPPSYEHLRVFGCLCFAYNMTINKDKFDSKSRECILIGYPYGQKAYKLYDLHTHTTFVSRDVVFFETKFPYQNTATTSSLSQTYTPPSLVHPGADDDCPISPAQQPIPTNTTPHITLLISTPLTSSSSSDNSSSSPPSSSNIPTLHTYDDPQNSPVPSPPSHNPDLHNSEPEIPTEQPTLTHKSSRNIQAPKKFADYVTTYLPHKQPSLPSLDSQSQSFAVNSCLTVEPRTYNQAKHHSHWVEAMNKELEALEANNTWELTLLPKGKRSIGSKWVYKTKLNPYGTIERHKARLVATGYQQIEGEDFTQTFSPVAKLATVRVLIAVATMKNWPLSQLDVNNAFLHGFLDEEVYMTPPPGYSKAKHGEVCKLRKSLYGLKQAPRQWNKELSKFLHSQGFQQSKQDYSLYTRRQDGEFLALLVYVDDILLTGTSTSQMDAIKLALDEALTIKDLGSLHYFLGMEAYKTKSGKFLSQKKYIQDILTDSGMVDCVSSPAPLPAGLKLSIDDGDLIAEPDIYRRLVGRLLYLGLTRPDLSYSVQHLSQFMHAPRVPHLRAVLHVLKYLKGTPDYGMLYSADSVPTVTAYSDADWSACQFSSRSLSAYAVFLGSNLVSWKTKKQQTVSKSSAEAEYRSMSATASELLWLQGLLEDLQLKPSLPITMYCDNKSAEHLAHNPKFHEKTKHLKRDVHFVREQVEAGFLTTQHVTSQNQLADLLTKPLASTTHHFLCSKLGLVSQVQLEGGV